MRDFTAKALALIGIGLCYANESRSAEGIPDDPVEYTGCIRLGFEEAFFVPLPNNPLEKWWIVAVPPDFKAMISAVPMTGDRRIMFARVYAKPGPRGHYGHHLGMASRQVTIGAVVELRQFEESDGTCHVSTPPPPVPPPEANKPLVPTRNGEAPLLAAQRRR
jgi:hypothetical protein